MKSMTLGGIQYMLQGLTANSGNLEDSPIHEHDSLSIQKTNLFAASGRSTIIIRAANMSGGSIALPPADVWVKISGSDDSDFQLLNTMSAGQASKIPECPRKCKFCMSTQFDRAFQALHAV